MHVCIKLYLHIYVYMHALTYYIEHMHSGIEQVTMCTRQHGSAVHVRMMVIVICIP